MRKRVGFAVKREVRRERERGRHGNVRERERVRKTRSRSRQIVVKGEGGSITLVYFDWV